jgi:small subunit ribosomal protein S15
VSRIHSRRKGRSGSHRPYPFVRPAWVAVDAEEATEQAVRLARSGLSSAQVGATLRDGFGIPSIRLVTGKRLRPLLVEHGVPAELPEDLQSLLRRVVHLQQHIVRHPHDESNRRGLSLIESRIRRLAKYYRRRRILPEDWRYSSARAVLQVE